MTFTTKGSERIYLSGKVSWVRYTTPDPVYNKWNVQLHPDEESLKKLQELKMDRGIKNEFKKDEDGYYMNFSRPAERKIKGKIIAMTAPVVVDKDNQPMENIAIGNGSVGTLKIELYQHGTPNGGKAWAARWEALRIDDLVPYNMETDGTPEQKELAGGLAEQPKPLF